MHSGSLESTQEAREDIRTLSMNKFLTNWGHCKLKLTQIKCHQINVGLEERGIREYPGKNLLEQRREPTNSAYDAESRNRTRATLVGGECSHHYATTALREYSFSDCGSCRNAR